MKTCKSHDLRLVIGFLYMIPKASAMKDKKNKFDFRETDREIDNDPSAILFAEDQ